MKTLLNWNCESSKFHHATVDTIDLIVLQKGPNCEWEIRVGSGVLRSSLAFSMDEAKRDAEKSLKTLAENLVRVLSC